MKRTVQPPVLVCSPMKDDCEFLGEYLVKTNKTVRAAADELGIPKSTIHYRVTTQLSLINPALAKRVRKVLDKHTEVRSHNAGMATSRKRKQLKSA